MRSADEAIALFKQVIQQRREYVRDRYHEVEMKGREQQPYMEKMLRGGMLSELTTLECLLSEIEQGKDVSQYWLEGEREIERVQI